MDRNKAQPQAAAQVLSFGVLVVSPQFPISRGDVTLRCVVHACRDQARMVTKIQARWRTYRARQDWISTKIQARTSSQCSFRITLTFFGERYLKIM